MTELKCGRVGCGKFRADNVHATKGTCFAKPDVCRRIHKHHEYELPSLK